VPPKGAGAAYRHQRHSDCYRALGSAHRFGFHSLDMLLAAQAWPVEIVNLAKNQTTEDRIAD